MTWAGKGKVAVAGIGFSALTRRAEDNLGKLAFEIDGQETVDEAGAQHLDMVGQLEAALERPAGNAAMQILPVVLAGLLTRHHEHVLLLGDAGHVAIARQRSDTAYFTVPSK